MAGCDMPKMPQPFPQVNMNGGRRWKMCKAKPDVPAGVLLAAGVLAAVVVAGLVTVALVPFLAVLGVAEAAAAAAMLGALGWLLRYGGWHRPGRPVAAAVPSRAALTVGPPAIEQARPPVVHAVITDARARELTWPQRRPQAGK